MAPPDKPEHQKPARAWQRMLSGRRLDILDPSPLDVEIEDIAHGLARVARWNGQTRGGVTFSVAQHSVLVAEILGLLEPAAPARWRLFALLHDAPEYVIGDMISPFKAALGDVYRQFEARLGRAIMQRFSISPDPSPALARMTKKADRISAFFEATLYAGFDKSEAEILFGAPGIDLRRVEAWLAPMPPEQAQGLFLEKFRAFEEGL
jgi:5'-deoxynucleotidase YfbR-like HD superfamily hydrolase